MRFTFTVPSNYNFLGRFYRLASISVLANMMVPLAGLVDIAFLGHLTDIRHLAGVILATILFDYLYRVLKFMRSSTNAITAQAVGQNDDKAVILAGLRSGLIALLVGLIIVLLQYPLQKIGFFILSGSSDIESAGVDYFYARIWGAPAVLLNFVLFGWFLGREMNWVMLLMSIVGNGSNVLLDYLMISKWGWASVGAGLATALSQYLALIVGLIWMFFTIPWQAVPAAIQELFDWVALKETFALKGNILIRFLVLVSVYSIFTNLSATMGTTVLAQNGLLLQIALLSQFTIQGVGVTMQTLTANFKSKGNTQQIIPLLIVSLVTSVVIALGFAGTSIFFPDQVFGLLTNHTEVNQEINQYTIWLLPILVVTAITFMLEGYFIGLKESATLRNAVLLSFIVGFMPLLIAAWYFHNNHLLWSTLLSYMTSNMILLGVSVPQTFKDKSSENQPLISS
ncbi:MULTISPECIES: guanitoxin biosynthesis MATE family efflux transporter GntT [Nostocales]|uniref:MATE family efflux transporter n=1 Tax=Dolichospermum flos-aquae UHCC 0037 TaxID=2590026 RepID=A0ACC7S0S1_DOLFA|nr:MULTISPECIES: guanitoxin biosynthesis MATE family efflux transporter GntT [Nostocales]MBO1064169.1 MATE family efflux transporter [Anabaena sp. 54]MCX5981697.1 MATE family efflux transporter [Nostocales cyanobacterium LacPavin_0920_SED1_MAG_38_18]MTJ42028.1 MATE family efflux transporter [Dolichospermum flos-aquae UHCC 0037]